MSRVQMREELARMARFQRALFGCAIVLFLLCLPAMLALILWVKAVWPRDDAPTPLMSTLCVVSVTPTLAWMVFLKLHGDGLFAKRYLALLSKLHDRPELADLPALVAASEFQWAQGIVEGGLMRLLPKLTEADRGLLSRRDQRRLWEYMFSLRYGKWRHQVSLPKVTVRAMAIVAGDEYYRKMESVGRLPSSPQNASFKRTVDESLEVFRARRSRVVRPDSLLRPAGVHDDELLRAASAGPPGAERDAELLRPGG